MIKIAEKLVERYGLLTILEESGITETDVVAILLDKGLIDETFLWKTNPTRLYYGDDEE